MSNLKEIIIKTNTVKEIEIYEQTGINIDIQHKINKLIKISYFKHKKAIQLFLELYSKNGKFDESFLFYKNNTLYNNSEVLDTVLEEFKKEILLINRTDDEEEKYTYLYPFYLSECMEIADPNHEFLYK